VLGIGIGQSTCREVARVFLHTSSAWRWQKPVETVSADKRTDARQAVNWTWDVFVKHVGVCACIYYKVQSTSTSKEQCRSAVSTPLYPARLGPWFHLSPSSTGDLVSRVKLIVRPSGAVARWEMLGRTCESGRLASRACAPRLLHRRV